jgi:histidinol-phosphate aminotransferase
MLDQNGLGVINPPSPRTGSAGDHRSIVRIVDLAHNESPWGPAHWIMDAATTSMPEVHRYPEPYGRSLAERIARLHGFEAANVLVAAGGTQVLTAAWTAFVDPGQAYVYSWPGFALYPMVASWLRLEPIPVPLTNSYGEDLDALADAIRRHRAKAVVICNPHNPTGSYVPAREARHFLDAVPTDVLVIFDEAYAEYATADDFPDLTEEALARPNLVLARSFSKIYGLASMRVGYGVASAALVDRLRAAIPPYAVAGPALAAAEAAVTDQGEIVHRARVTAEAARGLGDALRARSMTVLPTQANFLYVRPPANRDWAAELADRGVLVRAVDNHLRITIGTQGDLRRLCSALDAITHDSRTVTATR